MLIVKRHLNIILNGRVMSEDFLTKFLSFLVFELESGIFVNSQFDCIYILLHQHSMSIVLPGVQARKLILVLASFVEPHGCCCSNCSKSKLGSDEFLHK